MSPLKIALFAAASALSTGAWAQANVNEGPRAVPRAEHPYDAEHAPTRGNAAQDRTTGVGTQGRASGDAAQDRASGDAAGATDSTYRLKDARARDAGRERDEAGAQERQSSEPANVPKDEQQRSSERR